MQSNGRDRKHQRWRLRSWGRDFEGRMLTVSWAGGKVREKKERGPGEKKGKEGKWNWTEGKHTDPRRRAGRCLLKRSLEGKKKIPDRNVCWGSPCRRKSGQFAFYRKKKIQILEWWLIIDKLLLRKSLLEAEPFSVRGECIITLLSPNVAQTVSLCGNQICSHLCTISNLRHPKDMGRRMPTACQWKPLHITFAFLNQTSISMRSTLGLPMAWQESSPPWRHAL